MLKPKSIKIFNEETNVNFYAWQIIVQGFFRSKLLKKYIDSPKAQTAHIIGDHGRSGIDIESWNELGEEAMRRLRVRAWNLQDMLQEHFELGQRITRLYKVIRGRNLQKVSNRQFLKWFRRLWSDFLELNGVGMAAVISDYEHEALSSELRRILIAHRVAKRDQPVFFNSLMAPTLTLSTWDERKAMLELAVAGKTLPKVISRTSWKRHLDHYEWLNYGYQGPAMHERDSLIALEKIFTNPKSPRQQLQEHQRTIGAVKLEQSRILERINLSPVEKYLFRAAGVFTFVKGYRIDIRYRFHFISDRMFGELAQRFSLPLDWFHFAFREEIENLLQGKRVRPKEALQRSKEVLWVIDQHGERIIPRSKIHDFYQRYVREDVIEPSQELRGQPAFLGKVMGRVKIVRSIGDVDKVQHGDILVALTTTPDFLPAMYRAAAFVTDIGGITSHAAIVAREMKKPCIIGTKIATKVLKDGDKVEVDATQGVVRKL